MEAPDFDFKLSIRKLERQDLPVSEPPRARPFCRFPLVPTKSVYHTMRILGARDQWAIR